ncbi:MAG: hypothetical protein LRZ91_03870 [Desulfotomaculum sp.]|nr:hypothetical protein [Desulfotomaculum sp.]MCL0032698.1 hypothetical protein [Peptococcaceae bacterium]
MTVSTTINAQTANLLDENKLAQMIRNMQFDKKYAVQIFNFFTDVPIQDVERFIVKYNLSDKRMKEYYEAYVKEYYYNPQLEELFV